MLSCCLVVAFLVLVSGDVVPNVTKGLIDAPGHRIVGGITVTIQQFPYQLVMLYQGRLRCGAAILSNRFALSAAHCVFGISSKDVILRAGSSFSSSGGTTHPASNIYIHDKYDENTIDYDVSLITVSTNFQFDATRQPISILDGAQPLPGGSYVTASGWGTTSEGGTFPNQLQAVTIPVVDWNYCNDLYSNNGGISSRMFCAGNAGHDSCQGDSGGPVVYGDSVVGVVSWGIGCARPTYPGVYALLTNSGIRDWIKAISNL